VLGVVGQQQQQMQTCRQPAHPNVEGAQAFHQGVAATTVAVAHPTDVLVVLAAPDEVGHRQLIDGVDVEHSPSGNWAR
jgi:hypothetical protein